MRVLVTAFEPFNDEKVNSSLEVLKKLPNIIDGIEIIKLELPVVRYDSLSLTYETARLMKPDIILCLGEAGGRDKISYERIGINIDDYRIPDNANNKPIDEKIFEDGKDAYFSSIPNKKIVEKINEKSDIACISNTAGTFVCNHVFYGIHYYIDKGYLKLDAGFIHFPYLKEQTTNKINMPYMNIYEMVETLIVTIRILSGNQK